MKTNWQTKKLEEIVDFIGGLWVGKKEPFVKVNVLRNTNFRNTGLLNFDNVAKIDVEEKQLSSRTLEKGDIILEKSGGGPDQPVGRVAYFDTDGIYSYSNFTCCIRIHNKTEVDPKYLWYFLYSQYSFGVTEKMQKQTTGIRNLIMPEYKNLQIPLPPLETQKEIVAKLDERFAKLREAKQLRQEALADTEKILSQALREIFEEGKKKGWEEKSLGSVCLKTENIKWSENKESVFNYIDLSSVSRKDFSISKTQKVDEKNAPSRAKKVVQTNDVIFGTTRPTLMRVAIIPESYNNQLCSTGFCVLKADINKILSPFIFYFIQSNLFMDRMEKIQTGASYPAVSDSKVLETIIPLPPLSEQQRIVARLDTLSAQISMLCTLQQDQLADLKKLEKAYLREAFRGELV